MRFHAVFARITGKAIKPDAKPLACRGVLFIGFKAVGRSHSMADRVARAGRSRRAKSARKSHMVGQCDNAADCFTGINSGGFVRMEKEDDDGSFKTGTTR
jgi:hypothetical protein